MNLWNTKRTAKSKYQRAGFTLLELLVVISIIGILTAIGMVAFSQAQKKGRDAKRVGDMRSIQSAFEQYNSQNNGSYHGTCSTMATGGGLPAMPSDPKTTGWTGYTTSCSTTTYCVCAHLEGSGTPGNSDDDADAICSGLGTAGSYFCVKNLQ